MGCVCAHVIAIGAGGHQLRWMNFLHNGCNRIISGAAGCCARSRLASCPRASVFERSQFASPRPRPRPRARTWPSAGCRRCSGLPPASQVRVVSNLRGPRIRLAHNNVMWRARARFRRKQPGHWHDRVRCSTNRGSSQWSLVSFIYWAGAHMLMTSHCWPLACAMLRLSTMLALGRLIGLSLAGHCRGLCASNMALGHSWPQWQHKQLIA